jgi:hypothetical protein
MASGFAAETTGSHRNLAQKHCQPTLTPSFQSFALPNHTHQLGTRTTQQLVSLKEQGGAQWWEQLAPWGSHADRHP